MNSSDVRLRKLSLSNFRGAKELVECDFTHDCRSAVIFGFNGEGKSTFAQAIEWFYRDSIDYLMGSGSEGIVKEDIVNLSAGTEDEASVSVEFNEKKFNATKVFKKAEKKSKFSNTSSEFVQYLDHDVIQDRIYLNQHTMLWFLIQTKGGKRDEIAKIIGYKDILNVREAIGKSLRELERSSELVSIKNQISNNDGIMTREIYGDVVVDNAGLIEKSAVLLRKIGFSETVDSIQALNDALVKVISLLPDEKRASKRVALENLKSKTSSLLGNIGLRPNIRLWRWKAKKIIQEAETVKNINLSDFLMKAEAVLRADPALITCPLCERPFEDREKALHSIVSRYQKYQEIRGNYNAIKQQGDDLKNSLGELSKNIQAIKTMADESGIQIDNKKFVDLVDLLRNAETEITTSMKNMVIDSIELNKIKGKELALKAELNEMVKAIAAQIEGLSFTKEEKEKQDAYQKLNRGKDLALHNILNRKKVVVYENQIRDMRYIENQIVDIQNSTLKKALDLLSEDMNDYFCHLNKRDSVKDVKLELKGDEGVEFTLNFNGHQASPPRKYLSESQLNSLGIALFLAAARKFNRANKFIVLDDVLISFDRRYRMRLLDLLSSKFNDFQILLLTQEDYWFQQIRRQFPTWIKKEITWEFKDGIRYKADRENWLELARERLNKKEKVGNDLRIGVESLLKEICLALEVPLAYRLGEANERRMVGELFSAITGLLKDKKSNLQDEADYKGLEVCNFITTAASHDNADLDDRADLDETITKIEKFRALFVCPKGEFVKKSTPVPGQDELSCECGGRKIRWKA